MDYWSTQRKGANFFNRSPSEDWFVSAKAAGIQFARLATDKWSPGKKDFLIGDADAFVKIPPSDLRILKTSLDHAQANNVRVVITLLSLPGSRWRQNNSGKEDLRIWQSNEYQNQAISFWKALAKELKDHPAIVGYNILNEPHPECLFGIHDYEEIELKKFYKTAKGSKADLNIFYRKMVSAIREVDPDTPIIIDTGLYATPFSISYLKPIEDEKIIYSFHMYEPYTYTTRRINNKRFLFPGDIPDHDPSKFDAKITYWDGKRLEQFFNPVLLWQKQHNIPSSQILVGEFGCDRTAEGASQYLSQLISIFNRNNWHWAFYSFREDCWDSMDYELGSEEIPKYWDLAKKGANLNQFRKNNSLFDVIKKELENNSFE